MDGTGGAGRLVALPRRPETGPPLRLEAALLLDIAADLLRAEGPREVADAALRRLCEGAGVRSGALVAAPGEPVLLAPGGRRAPGGRLPRGATRLLSEVARTSALRVAGSGPCLVAAPAGSAVLLLELPGPPPASDVLDLLARLAGAVGAALVRAEDADRVRTDLLVLEEGLAARQGDADGLVVHTRPCRGALSGDVVELVQEGPDRWLLVADVCGRGHVAAVAADRLRAAFRACAPGSPGPSAVLARLDRCLGGGEEDFATALVVLAQDGGVVVASAGHPAPLLVPGGRVPLLPAAPLGLHLDAAWSPTADVGLELAPGALLVAATDGLVDRAVEVDLDAVVARLPRGLTARQVADTLLEACTAAGPAQDDASLLVLQP